LTGKDPPVDADGVCVWSEVVVVVVVVELQ
jgi:hypothetical protein